jgi:uncharacterized protein
MLLFSAKTRSALLQGSFDLAADDTPYDALDAYLESDRSPPESMLISDLDGFLTAVAIGPELIKPSEWLRVVWGGEQPVFADENEAQAVLDAIMNRYNQILRDVERYSLEPIFWTDPDGTIIAADWAEGFALGIGLRPKSWDPLFRSKKHGTLFLPILALCSDGDGESALGLNAEAEEEIMADAADLIPDCVIGIAAFWRSRRSRNAKRLH